MRHSLNRVEVIELPTFRDAERGALTVAEPGTSIPFSISRVFYLHGLPSGSERGAHAHRKSEQIFIAVSGSFTLNLTNGSDSREYEMNDPVRAVFVPPMIWARLHGFSEDAVCLVLTNSLYDPADYIHDWNEFASHASQVRS